MHLLIEISWNSMTRQLLRFAFCFETTCSVVIMSREAPVADFDNPKKEMDIGFEGSR